MRPDMFKVIVERPRLRFPKKVGSAYPRGKIKNQFERDWELSPRCLGIGVPHRRKSLNENLAPLERFLRSRVGRPYDRVRSEILEQLSMNSAVQKHVVDHLQDLVWEQTELVDGVLHGRFRSGGYCSLESYRRRRLYVCPRTGLLRELPPRARRQRAGRPEVVPLNDLAELRRIDGVWKHVRFARLPSSSAQRARCLDILIGDHLTSNWFGASERFQRFYGRADRYAVALRDPGLRELAVLARRQRRS